MLPSFWAENLGVVWGEWKRTWKPLYKDTTPIIIKWRMKSKLGVYRMVITEQLLTKGYIGIMAKKMETAIVCCGYMGILEKWKLL